MMKRRMIIGTLALMMAVTPMATGFSFADDTVSNDRPKVHARGGANEENRVDQNEKMQEIIDMYYSDISDEWTDVHDALQEAMQELRELNKPQNDERPQGKIGQEGSRGILSEYLNEGESIDDLTDEEIDEIKDALFDKIKGRYENRGERADGREGNKDQNEALRTAVEEEDIDTIQSILDDMLENAKERLEDTQEKLAEVKSAE